MGRRISPLGGGVRPLILPGVALMALALAVAQAAPRGAGPWVFSYFLDNGQDGLHLAYSRDGLKWTPLGDGRPYLAPAVGGKLIRDPCIILGPDNVFHAVWTTGWYEQGIGIAHSRDLVKWDEAVFLPVMVHERKAANAWAPEIFYDGETSQYLIFWATTIPGRFPATDASGSVSKEGIALNHRIYRTTTRDFKEYSRAELFLDPGFNVIDATIVRDGQRVFMFLKDETLRPDARKDIRMAVADHALGPYTVRRRADLEGELGGRPDRVQGGPGDVRPVRRLHAQTLRRREVARPEDVDGAGCRTGYAARREARLGGRRIGKNPQGATCQHARWPFSGEEGRSAVTMTISRVQVLKTLVLAACLVAGLVSVQPSRLSAQGQAAPAGPAADAIRTLQWRNIGPTAQAGRVPVFVGLPGDINTMYVAGAVGGIFKTTNGGVTWKAIFDSQPVASIGAIAIAPTDPNVIYAGTGEGNPRNDASIGDGIYKSIDAGEHWTNVGLPDSEKIARLVIDPRNADVVYACALGREWGPNEERGLFKTTDGGKSWKKVLYKNDLTGCSDVDIDPTNANIVYAGMFTFRRWAWYTESGGGRDGGLQVVRRRRHVDAALRARRPSRPAEGPHGPDRRRRVAQQSGHGLRGQRDHGRRRTVAVRRRGGVRGKW